MKTKFAPAGRASVDDLERQKNIFQENPVLDTFLGKVPSIFIILNKHRQIVYMNKGALDFSGLNAVVDALGKRPGELLDCIHSKEEIDGCGTAEACTFCGAVDAVLTSQKGKPAVRDARLLVGDGRKAVDLRVWAMPLEIEGEAFTAVTIQDINREKRLLALERVFYHDILNTVTGLASNIALLRNYRDRVNVDEMLAQADALVQRLIDEIHSQQLLTAAEGNILKVQLRDFSSKALLGDIVIRYMMTELVKNKKLEIDMASEVIDIRSDKVITSRILDNMVKNALEATPDGGTVRLGCKGAGGRVTFWVHNEGYIPREVQLQIFTRSFSTKGRDRGLGTYSMMLLSKYLQGSVSFTTSKENGTTFFLDMPQTLTLETNAPE
ncbi:MAG: sensor histidine kinase [Candidatus Sigynarchaeota archaeon]